MSHIYTFHQTKSSFLTKLEILEVTLTAPKARMIKTKRTPKPITVPIFGEIGLPWVYDGNVVGIDTTKLSYLPCVDMVFATRGTLTLMQDFPEGNQLNSIITQ